MTAPREVFFGILTFLKISSLAIDFPPSAPTTHPQDDNARHSVSHCTKSPSTAPLHNMLTLYLLAFPCQGCFLLFVQWANWIDLSLGWAGWVCFAMTVSGRALHWRSQLTFPS